MTPQILTLCYKCSQTYAESYGMKKYPYSKATTKPQKACQCCGIKSGALEMYIVDSKKGRKNG